MTSGNQTHALEVFQNSGAKNEGMRNMRKKVMWRRKLETLDPSNEIFCTEITKKTTGMGKKH